MNNTLVFSRLFFIFTEILEGYRNTIQYLLLESGHCLMCKINTLISLYYVLLLFRYGLSYLVMWSLRMIMCTFSLTKWSFNLIVRSLYLVMWTSHLVIISYFLVMCSYHLVQRSFYLIIRSCHFVMCFFNYSLFLCAPFMRCYYVLFLCALLIRSL